MARRKRKPVKYKTRKRSILPALLSALLLLTAAGAAILYFNTPQRRLERALTAGARNLSEGDYIQALEDYVRALDVDPLNRDAHTGRISAERALGNAQGVFDAYKEACANPEQTGTEELRLMAADSLYAIGDSFFSGGDYEEARAVAALLKEVDETQAAGLTDRIVEVTAPPVGSLMTVGDMEYRVLERQGSSVLLYAEKAVDLRPFTETQVGVSWSYATLRAWLNKDWINTLSGEDTARIVLQTIDNPAYPNDPESRAYGETEDRVFLLSVPELLTFFPSESDRATGYAYWTRTGTGRSDTKAVSVTESGAFETCDVRDELRNVRPAFWYMLE